MELSQVLSKIEGLVLRGDLKAEISSIEYDSRKVKPGSMFVAIKGFKQDGHEFIESAVENGATVVAVEEGYNVDAISEAVNVIIAKNTRKLLALSACNFYGHPSREFKLVGVTGTKGKTTTTYMIKSILEKSGKKVGLVGTIANYIGNQEIPTERTTPESVDLQKLFREMADAKVDVVVMEVSSHSLALDRVAGITFDFAIFTNLTQDHLDFHKTFDNYLAAKAILFQNAKEGFVNADDMYASRLIKLSNCPTITTYGIDNNPFVTARDIIITNSYAEFKLPFNKVIQKIRVDIPGRFTVYNALAAICVCIKLGCSLEAIISALENIKVPGRSETVSNLRGYTIIVDYAHTPDSLENIIKACKTYTKGNLICVFGCGGDRDKAKRPMMGEIAGRLANYTVITTDNPRTEVPEEIISEIENGIKKTKGKYKVIVDRAKAIEHALRKAQKNDLVLIAGKGHETYQEVNGVKHHFDDREVATEALKKLPEVKDDDLYLW